MQTAIKVGLGLGVTALVGAATYFGLRKEPKPLIPAKVWQDVNKTRAEARERDLVELAAERDAAAREALGIQPVVSVVTPEVDFGDIGIHRHSDGEQTTTIDPVVRMVVSDTAAAEFDSFYKELEEEGLYVKYCQQWGGVKKGYKGLIRNQVMPGYHISENEADKSRLIYQANIKGDVVVVYERYVAGDTIISYNCMPDVQVTFENADMSVSDMIKFSSNEFRP